MSRFQAWMLGSRIRYAVVWGAINAATVSSIYLIARIPEVSAGSVLRYALMGFVLNASVQALFGFPSAKRKLAKRA